MQRTGYDRVAAGAPLAEGGMGRPELGAEGTGDLDVFDDWLGRIAAGLVVR